MFSPRVFRFSAAIAAALAMAAPLVSAPLAAPPSPSETAVRQIGSGAGKLNSTDIAIERSGGPGSPSGVTVKVRPAICPPGPCHTNPS